MDEGNNVHLPDNKKLQFYISVSGTEQVPDAIYKNEDDTSQVSSQYSDSENDIVLTLTGSSWQLLHLMPGGLHITGKLSRLPLVED